MAVRPSSNTQAPTLPPQGSTPFADELERMTLVGARPRLLFVIGETKTATTEDITQRVQAESETVINGGAFSPAWEHILRPLGTWSYAIRHRIRDLFLIDEVAAATGLRYVSVLSVGKAGQCNADAVRKAIEDAEPDLIVCAGAEAAYWPLVGRLQLGYELLTTVYGEPVFYSLLKTDTRQTVLLHFWDPSIGYHTEGGHHYLFKLLLHAYDALCRKRLLSWG